MVKQPWELRNTVLTQTLCRSEQRFWSEAKSSVTQLLGQVTHASALGVIFLYLC